MNTIQLRRQARNDKANTRDFRRGRSRDTSLPRYHARARDPSSAFRRPPAIRGPGDLDRQAWADADGASRWPLRLGMPVVNLVGKTDAFERFHLAADADASSVNVSSLAALAAAVERAVVAYMCGATAEVERRA